MITSIINNLSFSELEDKLSTLAFWPSFSNEHREQQQLTPHSPIPTIKIVSSLLKTEYQAAINTQPSPIDILRADIVRYGYLPDYEYAQAQRPSQHMLELATQFLSYLPSGIPLPRPMISEEGDIGFFWDSSVAFADIEIEESGELSIFTKSKQEPSLEKFYDNVTLSPQLRSSLKEKLETLLID